jgi:hypothetical protein
VLAHHHILQCENFLNAACNAHRVGYHSNAAPCALPPCVLVTSQSVACLDACTYSLSPRLSSICTALQPQSNMQASAPPHIPAPDMYAPQPVQVVVVGVNTQTAAVDMNTNIKCCQKPAGSKHQCYKHSRLLLSAAPMIASVKTA